MPDEKSKLESVSGNPVAKLAAAALAAFPPGGPATVSMVYALLPVLMDCLARGRADKRLKEWTEDVDSRLRLLGDHFNRFSDAQYRLTVGIVQTAFETIEEEKLRMLKAAVLNIAGSDYLEGFEAQLFSRILRDVSAAEIAFLVDHRDLDSLAFDHNGPPHRASIRDPREVTLARGLINLGILVRSASEGLASDTGAYYFAPFVPKLLDLIVGRGTEPPRSQK
jgi:hypothetical protein